MRVYVVRHGQTEGNAAQTHQTDATVLSNTGEKQAKKIAARFAHTPIDVIIASPAVRTQQTAKAIAAVTHAPIETNASIIEKRNPHEVNNLHWGSAEVRPIWETIFAHVDDPDYHYSDEENNWDFIKRVSTVFPMLEKRAEDNIAVVTHGFVVRALTGFLLFGSEFSTRQFEQLKHKTLTTNTGVTIFEYTTEHGWVLLTYNDHAHLLE